MRSLISFLSSVRWIIRLIGFLMHSYRWWGWKDRNITSVNPKRISWLQMSFLAPQKTRGKVSNVAQKLHFCWVNLTSLEFLSEHWLTNQNRKNLLKLNLGQIAPLWTHNFQSLFSAEDQNQQPTLFSNSRFTRKQEKTLKKVMTVGVHWWFQDRFLPLRIFVPFTRLKLPTLWWFFPWN